MVKSVPITQIVALLAALPIDLLKTLILPFRTKDESPTDENSPIATTAKVILPTTAKVQTRTVDLSDHHLYRGTTFILSFVIIEMF